MATKTKPKAKAKPQVKPQVKAQVKAPVEPKVKTAQHDIPLEPAPKGSTWKEYVSQADIEADFGPTKPEFDAAVQFFGGASASIPSGLLWKSIDDVRSLTAQLSFINSGNESLLDRVFGEHAPSATDKTTRTNNNASTVGPAKSKMDMAMEELQLEINRASNIAARLKTIA